MTKRGWISLHRKVQSHWLWDDKPFSKGQAWIDMLLLANHSDKKFLLGNELVEVKSGSFITSELKLMDRWGWGKAKTRNFLKLLENDGMIVKISDRKKTTINIVNYSDYTVLKTTDRPQADHEQTASRPPADTNNNYNNDNNDYNNVVVGEDFSSPDYNDPDDQLDYCNKNKTVMLSENQIEDLLEKMELHAFDEYVNRLDNYITSTGAYIKNHYETILKWYNEDRKVRI